MDIEVVLDAEAVNTTVVSDDEDETTAEDATEDSATQEDATQEDGTPNEDAQSKQKASKLHGIDINRAHDLLDHPGESALRQAAKTFGWKLLGTLRTCEPCVKAKATAKPTSSVSTKVTTKPGERLFWDLSGPFKQTRGHNRYHGLVVDQATARFWSYFHHRKVDFDGDLRELFQMLKAKEHPVRYLRLDNAPEWTLLKPLCAEFGIQMEFTAPNTPQFNANVERGFPTVRNMAYASLLASDLTEEEQGHQWANALQDATVCRNLIPRKGFPNAYDPFGEVPPVRPEHLAKFGEKGWMTLRTKLKTKFTPKAEAIRRVGYATDHSSDTYVVQKLSTKRCVISRDITWERTRRMDRHDPSPTTPTPPEPGPSILRGPTYSALVSDEDSDSDDDDVEETSQIRRKTVQFAPTITAAPTRPGTPPVAPAKATPPVTPTVAAAPPKKTTRAIRELKNLQTSFNDTTTAVEDLERQVEAVNNVSVNSDPGDPKNDKEAMNGPESKDWWQGTVNEYDGFFKLGTWKLVKRKDAKVGSGNKPLTTKNVFKKKLHAITKAPRFRVRNCVRGFDMVPGVHFDESFAPTPTNQSVRVVFAISLYKLRQLGVDDIDVAEKEWVVGDLFDVVQAFLNSEMDLTNPVYIYLPPRFKEYCELRGMEYDPTDLIQLCKAQYGQVDAAKRWMDMFIQILTEDGGCELTQCKSDPCVLYKRNAEGKLLALIVLYIDDAVVCGDPEMVKRIKTHLKSKVDILDIGRMDTHLGVDYELKKDEHGWYYECSMRKYVVDAVKEFENHIGTELKDFRTPAAPGSVLMKRSDDDEPIDSSGYRKFVGKMLYAVMKVLPDHANAVRDLTCHLSNPGTEHWEALTRFMSHLKYRYRPLKLRAPISLRTVAAFDADWATDKNDRKSISSYLTTIGGTALVNWQSKKQNTVALSSCESETMAGTMVAKDVLFVNNLVEEVLGKEPEMPSYVYGDNVASLFLAQNNSVSQRTKHIDIRERFMGDLVKAGKVELRHIRSEDNPADINSKNVKIDAHERHAKKLYGGLPLATPIKEDDA